MHFHRIIRILLARLQHGSTDTRDRQARTADRLPDESWQSFRVRTGGSREEYIRLLLQAHGGRLWQAEIDEQADVSPATVSQWLAAMEADDMITRLRVGRQNVVCLPAAAPA